MGLGNLNYSDPSSLGPSPPSLISTYSDPCPFLGLKCEEIWDFVSRNSATSIATRKWFKVEFGRLKRNI